MASWHVLLQMKQEHFVVICSSVGVIWPLAPTLFQHRTVAFMLLLYYSVYARDMYQMLLLNVILLQEW